MNDYLKCYQKLIDCLKSNNLKQFKEILEKNLEDEVFEKLFKQNYAETILKYAFKNSSIQVIEALIQIHPNFDINFIKDIMGEENFNQDYLLMLNLAHEKNVNFNEPHNLEYPPIYYVFKKHPKNTELPIAVNELAFLRQEQVQCAIEINHEYLPLKVIKFLAKEEPYKKQLLLTFTDLYSEENYDYLVSMCEKYYWQEELNVLKKNKDALKSEFEKHKMEKLININQNQLIKKRKL